MKRCFILLSAILSLNSCVWFGAATPDPTQYGFFPGDCLKSKQLSTSVTRTQQHINKRKQVFEFPIILDFGDSSVVVLERIEGIGKISKLAIEPADDAYAVFGSNAKIVKKKYQDSFRVIREHLSGVLHRDPSCVTTIYYCGSMKLTSSHDFYGIKAGDDLSSIAYLYCDELPYDEYELPIISVPSDYQLLSPVMLVRIPLSEDDVIEDEDITFHIELSVKVGMFLAMLNDRLTDPDAEMQFRDEVLTCDFTIPRNEPIQPYPGN